VTVMFSKPEGGGHPVLGKTCSLQERCGMGSLASGCTQSRTVLPSSAPPGGEKDAAKRQATAAFTPLIAPSCIAPKKRQ
jgi:hypothetical protein